jgi:hypothetical protein
MVGNIVVPNTNNPIPERCQDPVAMPVSGVTRVLAAVDLNDESGFTTDEIDIVGTDRRLPDEFETTESSVAQLKPKDRFCIGAGSA